MFAFHEQVVSSFSRLDLTKDAAELQTDVAQRRATSARTSDQEGESDGRTGLQFAPTYLS